MPLPLSTPGRVLNLVCSCDYAGIRQATRSIRAFLEQQGLPASELDAWELVAAEAGNNAVKHARGDALRQPVELAVEVGPDRLELRVLDHTGGFDLPPAAELPDPLAEGGRGLFLMRSLADDLRYLRGRDGNCLVVRKRRPGAATAEAGSPSSIAEAALEATLQTMTEELAACYESLSAIFRFSSQLPRTTLTPDEIDPWLRELMTIVGADWYVLRLRQPGAAGLLAVCGSGLALSLPPHPDKAPADRASMEQRAAQERRDLWFSGETPLDGSEPLKAFGEPLAGVVHPLLVDADLVGVLSMGRHTTQTPFAAVQVNILHTFADFLGILIRSAWSRQREVQALLDARELDIAAAIHRSLLPARLPEVRGYQLAGHAEAARQVGGDWYDAIPIGANGVLLVIADVMGKGMPAALFATILRSQIRARLDLAVEPGRFLEWLNGALFADLDRVDMFITAQLVHLDTTAAELRVAGAGHCPLFVATQAGVRQVPGDGPPLGIQTDASYPEHRLALAGQDSLLLFTDGLVEIHDADGRMLGLETVAGWFRALTAAATPAPVAARTLIERAAAFRGDAPARDDLTFVLAMPDGGRLESKTASYAI